MREATPQELELLFSLTMGESCGVELAFKKVFGTPSQRFKHYVRMLPEYKEMMVARRLMIGSKKVNFG